MYVSNTQQGARTNLFAADAAADVHAADGQFSRLVATNLFAADATADVRSRVINVDLPVMTQSDCCKCPITGPIADLRETWPSRRHGSRHAWRTPLA